MVFLKQRRARYQTRSRREDGPPLKTYHSFREKVKRAEVQNLVSGDLV